MACGKCLRGRNLLKKTNLCSTRRRSLVQVQYGSVVGIKGLRQKPKSFFFVCPAGHTDLEVKVLCGPGKGNH